MSAFAPIEVTLAAQKLWEQFHPHTEMIVTKKKGRVIFPHLDYNVKGLEKNSLYTMQLHLQRVDNIKYKFDQGEWKEAGKGDPPLPIQYVTHSDGARSGEHWMSNPVSFSSLKITNDPNNENKKLVLVQSMHKYIPVLTITPIANNSSQEFRLQLTEFFVVTAYQSEEVNRLKTTNNKFASGFRANGKKRVSGESKEDGPIKRSPSSNSSPKTPPNPWNNPLNYMSTSATPVCSSSSGFPMANPTNTQHFNNYSWNQFYGNPWFYPNQDNSVSHTKGTQVPAKGKKRVSGESENNDPKRRSTSSDSSSSSSITPPNTWHHFPSSSAPSSTSMAPFYPNPSGFPMINPPTDSQFNQVDMQTFNHNSWNQFYGMPYYYPNQEDFMNMWNSNMNNSTLPTEEKR